MDEDKLQHRSAFQSAVLRRTILFLLLLIHISGLVHTSRCHPSVVDEPGHVLSGLAYWKSGYFNLYTVNPPLVKLLTSLPVLLSNPKFIFRPGRCPDDNWEDDHRYFFEANSHRYHTLIMRARWVVIALSVLCAITIYVWCRDVYGTSSALTGVFLWTVSPNVLAWSGVANVDIGATFFGLLSVFLFRRWLRRPSGVSAAAAGVGLGLAALTKYTLLLLHPVFGLLWVAHCLMRRMQTATSIDPLDGRTRLLHMGMIYSLSLIVINTGYAWDETGVPLSKFNFHSSILSGRTESGQPMTKNANRFHGTLLQDLPVPLPAQFVRGADVQKTHSDQGRSAYLRGTWREAGWWYYYFYAALVKVPLGTWALAVTAVVLAVCRTGFRGDTMDELCLLLPAMLIVLFLASQSGLNRHYRYVLPAYPFVIMAVSRVGKVFAAPIQSRRRVICICIVIIACAGNLVSCLRIHPHYISFFNAAAGGPAVGHQHLGDSNIDFGQDLLFLQRWLSRHPKIDDLQLAYYGVLDPSDVGIKYRLPDMIGGRNCGHARTSDGDQWIAVSVSLLIGKRAVIGDGSGGLATTDRNSFRRLRSLRPFARAGHSILIYRLTERFPRECKSVPLTTVVGEPACLVRQ